MIRGAQSSPARKALAEVQSIPEAVDIRDKAQAMGRYLKRREGAGDAARMALDIRLRAERLIGGFLTEAVQHQGGTVPRGNSRLPDDVSRKQSHHWQRIASLPDEAFEEELARPEPSTAALVRRAQGGNKSNITGGDISGRWRSGE